MRFSIIDIEKKLEVFFENKIQSLFNKNPLITLTDDLIEEFENGIRELNGARIAPNIIKIYIQEKNLFNEDELSEWRVFAQQLLSELSENNTYKLMGPIHIEAFFDKTIKNPHNILASYSVSASGKTINILAKPPLIPNEKNINGAFLILWNEEIYELTKNVTNIGRREDNDLIIDNLKVSRMHAQIRCSRDSFLLIDTDSVSGTKVNGNLIKQHQLSNGDVIEIADVPLIFSNESNFGENQPRSTVTKAIKTRISKKK